jgi:hypothetical protein
MANVAAHKYVGKGFSNEVQLAKFTYNFANDTGAQATYTLGTFTDKVMITNAIVQVETACAGATATVTIGLAGTDVDCFLTTAHGAVASLTDDATFKETAGQLIVVPDNETISCTIATADLTAGKINLFIEYINVA